MHQDRPRLILDATPLIHLTKAGLLEPTLKHFQVTVPMRVLEEVTQGDIHHDSVIIQAAADQGRIKVHKPGNSELMQALMRHKEIHRGEAETMAAAAELDIPAVMDNGVARAVANLYGIHQKPGTLYILFRLVSIGALHAADAEERLDQMVKSGLYLDSKTLIAAKEKLRVPQAGQPSQPRAQTA